MNENNKGPETLHNHISVAQMKDSSTTSIHSLNEDFQKMLLKDFTLENSGLPVKNVIDQKQTEDAKDTSQLLNTSLSQMFVNVPTTRLIKMYCSSDDEKDVKDNVEKDDDLLNSSDINLNSNNSEKKLQKLMYNFNDMCNIEERQEKNKTRKSKSKNKRLKKKLAKLKKALQLTLDRTSEIESGLHSITEQMENISVDNNCTSKERKQKKSKKRRKQDKQKIKKSLKEFKMNFKNRKTYNRRKHIPDFFKLIDPKAVISFENINELLNVNSESCTIVRGYENLSTTNTDKRYESVMFQKYFKKQTTKSTNKKLGLNEICDILNEKKNTEHLKNL